MFDLSPDQIADAETAGVSFHAATPAQVQRLSMQKNVFRVGGAPVLATRGGALFETAGTLERLIAQGEQQRRDLVAWESSLPGSAVEAPAPPRRPMVAEQVPSPQPAALIAPTASRPSKPRPMLRSLRWLTAGALRRGRMAQHWSSRGRR